MDPITAFFDFASKVLEAINQDQQLMLANANHDLAMTWANNKMQLIIRLQDIALRIIPEKKA